MHSYGIMTDVVDSSPEGGVSVIVSYTMDLAGETVSLPGMSVKYGVKKGPVVVMGNVQAPDKIRQLTEVGGCPRQRQHCHGRQPDLPHVRQRAGL